MRGVVWILLLSSLLLSACEVEKNSTFLNISEFNKVNIIDFPYEELDASESQSIRATYSHEQKAAALYRKVLDLFPGEEPFTTALYQQEFQINLVQEVFEKYELTPPEENWYPNVSRFSDPKEACGASLVFAEESVIFYEGWLDNQGFNYKVDNQDLRFLYTKLRDDYQKRMIPMFKRCGRGLR